MSRSDFKAYMDRLELELQYVQLWLCSLLSVRSSLLYRSSLEWQTCCLPGNHVRNDCKRQQKVSCRWPTTLLHTEYRFTIFGTCTLQQCKESASISLWQYLTPFLEGEWVDVNAICYPNGTVSYNWSSDPRTQRLQIEYQCYNATIHQDEVRSVCCYCYTF